MQEGVFTKIAAVATVIGVIIAILAWLSPTPLQEKSPVPSYVPGRSNLFDKNPLYTISSGSVLKALQDTYLPAYKEIIYIQKGKLILDKEKVDENDYLAIVKLNRKSSKTRRISSGNSFDITDSSRHGPEDREYRHTYVYLIINNNDIDYIKCLGTNNTEYITIGQFQSTMKGIVDVKIPVPKEI
ncbi:hypothetical protein GMJAKD_06480 [Candidatus Electrothrix aarhusensis]